MSKDTVTFIRTLRPYPIGGGAHNIDTYVQEHLAPLVDPSLLSEVHEYTRGMYSIDLHYESFRKYSTKAKADKQIGELLELNADYQQAKHTVRRSLRDLKHVQPIPMNELDRVRWVSSSAAGYGYENKKKGDCYLQARRNASRAYYEFIQKGDHYKMVPDKAFARSQLAKKVEPKIRHVWGRAFHHILMEGTIAQPLIERASVIPTPLYLSRDLHLDMPCDIHVLLANGDWAHCLDFSSFDATVPSALIDEAWDILFEILAIDENASIVFNYCKRLNTNTPVLMPDGRLFMVTRGIPSGSYFTQLIGSVVNLLIIHTLQIHMSGTVHTTFVMGDDSIFAMKQPLGSITSIAAYVMDHFGMKVNMDKSLITRTVRDVHFLGHNFYGTKVTRDVFTSLCLVLFTERPVTTPDRKSVV